MANKKPFGAAPGLIKNREFAPNGISDPPDSVTKNNVKSYKKVGDSFEIVLVDGRPTVKKITEQERKGEENE